MSIEDEYKLGREFLESVDKELATLDDTFVNQYLTDLGNYLGEFQDKKPFALTFYVAKENQLNAFAGPAGHIFIYSGLINIMDEVDELASVVSHEIGHVSRRHLSRQAEQGQLASIGVIAGMLAGALIGGDAGEALMIGSYAAGTQAMLSYSRDDEREADQLGFKKAYLAGFRPDAFVDALSKLQQGQWGVNQTPAYLLTHPVDSERMANLTAMSRIYPEPEKSDEAERFRRLYPLFRTIVRAQSTDPKDAERYFSSEMEKTPDSGIAHFGLAMALQNKGEYDSAMDEYNIALNIMDEKASVLIYMGETYLMKGQTKEAIGAFEKSLAIDKKDKVALYLLAMSYQDAEEYSKAIEIYDRLALMAPVKNDVFYNLGLCQGRENILGPAHYNFGRYYKRIGDMENADFHFKKAGELAGSDQELQDKIRKETEEMKSEKQPVQPPVQGG
ncbi:MAG: M48 family metalloprotease [Deltaproteobacteria bacterium]|nr:M48 family metalloprotease [Deltaproteobacteria bacterium]